MARNLIWSRAWACSRSAFGAKGVLTVAAPETGQVPVAGASGGVYGEALSEFGAARSVPAGTIYGALVYAAGYEGWLPVLGILPPAHRDRRGRVAIMLFAHLVYGASLAYANRRVAAPLTSIAGTPHPSSLVHASS